MFFDLSSFFSDNYAGNEAKVHARMAGAWNRTVSVKLRKDDGFQPYDFGGRRLSDLGD